MTDKKLENHEKLQPNTEGQSLNPEEEIILEDLKEIIKELEDLLANVNLKETKED